MTDTEVFLPMHTVERHLFVPSGSASWAYHDGSLPIGYGQTILQPYKVAYMTDILKLEKTRKVHGVGSGCQASILGEICYSVLALKLFPSLEKEQ